MDQPNRPTVDSLVEELQDLDWPDRYRWIVELGARMSALPAELRTDQNRITACASKTWLVAETREGAVWFRGDSESQIVRGLVAIVLELTSGLPAREILIVPLRDLWTRLDLQHHMSPQRLRGLQALVARVRQIAKRSTR
jgi:cysteine desulfuration protein SufE